MLKNSDKVQNNNIVLIKMQPQQLASSQIQTIKETQNPKLEPFVSACSS